MKKEEPLLNADGTLKQSLLKVGGKSFSCSCKCNVFHNPDKFNLDIYQCNCCDLRYESEPKVD
jgi:hypothetical protein